MFAILHVLWIFVVDIFKSRRRLEAENLFLHHQLNIALRRVPPRLRLYGSDRALLVWMTRIWPGQRVDRWPIGWPSDVIFYSKHGGPVLRDAVQNALHRSDYGAFTHQLLQGPIDLSKHSMRPLANRLMKEILSTRSREIHKRKSAHSNGFG